MTATQNLLFPVLKIGETGNYLNGIVTRISHKMYSTTLNPKLIYTRPNLVACFNPKPIKLWYNGK